MIVSPLFDLFLLNYICSGRQKKSIENALCAAAYYAASPQHLHAIFEALRYFKIFRLLFQGN